MLSHLLISQCTLVGLLTLKVLELAQGLSQGAHKTVTVNSLASQESSGILTFLYKCM